MFVLGLVLSLELLWVTECFQKWKNKFALFLVVLPMLVLTFLRAVPDAPVTDKKERYMYMYSCVKTDKSQISMFEKLKRVVKKGSSALHSFLNTDKITDLYGLKTFSGEKGKLSPPLVCTDLYV